MKPIDIATQAPSYGARAFPTPIAGARPPRRRGSRMATGLTVSIALHAALAAALLFRGFVPNVVALSDPSPMVVELQMASPPDPVRETPPGPQQVEREASRPVPPEQPPLKTALAAPDPVFFAPPPRPVTPADPGPAAPETTAPPVQAAPFVAKAASNAAVTWEGQVLAALEKKKRYPPGAQSRRQQGVAYVRFRMERGGRVLWSRLERSSGFGELDRTAIETPKRAQPLPRIPDGRPDELELVAPVEFFIAGR